MSTLIIPQFHSAASRIEARLMLRPPRTPFVHSGVRCDCAAALITCRKTWSRVSRLLFGGKTAIHHDDRAGEKARQVAGHVHAKAGDFSGRGNAPEWMIVLEHRPEFLRVARIFGRAMHQRRVPRAAANGI